jgi:soluble lytic murein transglycosylase-like protein
VRWAIASIALLLAVGYAETPEERGLDRAPAPAAPVAPAASQPLASAHSRIVEANASEVVGTRGWRRTREQRAAMARFAARMEGAVRRQVRRSRRSLTANVRWAADAARELEAASVRRFDRHAREASRKHAVPVDLIRAVILVESRYNPRAVSPVGALGLMQLMPGTANDLQVRNARDARQNVLGGARLLRMLDDRFRDPVLTIAAYNAGPNAVLRYRGVPPYAETRRYVGRVLGAYQHYRDKSWLRRRAAR